MTTSYLRRGLLTASLSWGLAMGGVAAQPSPVRDLELFVNNTKSLKADFVQVTTKPNGQQTRPIRGKLELQRPGQFKFHYSAPFEQVIQSDGQTLTVFDVDLNQASQRKVNQVAAFAPALAVASAKDFAAVTQTLEIIAIPTPPNAQGRWLRATPKQAPRAGEADILGSDTLAGAGAHVELGFSGIQGQSQLTDLVIIDPSGQRTALKLDKFDLNPRFAPGHFRFSLPPGANLIKP